MAARAAVAGPAAAAQAVAAIERSPGIEAREAVTAAVRERRSSHATRCEEVPMPPTQLVGRGTWEEGAGEDNGEQAHGAGAAHACGALESINDTLSALEAAGMPVAIKDSTTISLVSVANP